jgi:2-C-methyl-D-erythritol 2,4-cyclodiphosphate synthase
MANAAMADIRIGQGIDIHQLVLGRPCIIGGVHIPFEKGLLGHSDADVLVHAIMDAFLGALGQRDIGSAFPDSDEQWKGADSIELLKMVWRDIKRDSWKIGNLDCTLLAEQPKISPYIEAMREKISAALEIKTNQIGIKATTTEKLGSIGRGEGITAFAVVLLTRES